jgi:DNA-binding winged helix-turn-helix (wHTH) protein
MRAGGQKVFCFEGCTLDLKRGSLRTENRDIELRPKSFALLRYLVENAGRLVPKDELIKAVWPKVIVTDESLARCVSDVRTALGDADQCIVKTMTRRGYLFASPVTCLLLALLGPRVMSDLSPQSNRTLIRFAIYEYTPQSISGSRARPSNRSRMRAYPGSG